jgi:hypothetical protein
MAISSYGTLFSTGSVVGEITNIRFGGVSASSIDVTKLVDADKSYICGFADGGTVTVTCYCNGAPTAIAKNTATTTSFVVSLGGATSTYPTVSFSAYVQGVSFEAAVDAAVMVTYTLRISGAVTTGNTA